MSRLRKKEKMNMYEETIMSMQKEKNQLQSFIESRLGEGGGGSLVVGEAAEDPDTVLENIAAAADAAGQAAYDTSVTVMSTKKIGEKYASRLRTESKVFGRKWTETIKR